MATYQSDHVSDTIPARVGVGDVFPLYGKKVVTAGAAIAAADVFEMVKVPAGATILDLILEVTALDSSTGIVLDVGDGADVDRFIDGATIGRSGAGGNARLGSGITTATGLNYTYTAEDTIDVLVATGPSGTASTTFTIKLMALATMQG